MKHFLAKENATLLEQMAWSRVLLAFDFDGTLAPIVTERDGAQMRAVTADLFLRICALYPCAVISGRSQSDVQSRLVGAQVKHVIGNHGLEPGGNLGEFAREIDDARALLTASLGHCPGVDVENKIYSLAIHYRRSRQKQEARSAIQAAIAALPKRMRIVPGKLVVNVIPSDAPNKADALLRLRAIEEADTALYVGDDVTDEDVFRLDQPGRLVSVRVGESRSSAAAYCLRNQQEINRLLARFVALRENRTLR